MAARPRMRHLGGAGRGRRQGGAGRHFLLAATRRGAAARECARGDALGRFKTSVGDMRVVPPPASARGGGNEGGYDASCHQREGAWRECEAVFEALNALSNCLLAQQGEMFACEAAPAGPSAAGRPVESPDASETLRLACARRGRGHVSSAFGFEHAPSTSRPQGALWGESAWWSSSVTTSREGLRRLGCRQKLPAIF
jgi:hypothetical protein